MSTLPPTPPGNVPAAPAAAAALPVSTPQPSTVKSETKKWVVTTSLATLLALLVAFGALLLIVNPMVQRLVQTVESLRADVASEQRRVEEQRGALTALDTDRKALADQLSDLRTKSLPLLNDQSLVADARSLLDRLAALPPESRDLVKLHATLPVGVVVASAFDSVPDGWTLCDGRSLKSDEYPDLFKAIGRQYGGNAANGTFNVPDYRGYFLRGADAARAVDKEDRALGSVQRDSTARPAEIAVRINKGGGHSHDIDTRGGRLVTQNGRKSPQDGDKSREEFTNEWGSTTTPEIHEGGGEHTHTAVTVGWDDETRPVNRSVLYLIKSR